MPYIVHTSTGADNTPKNLEVNGLNIAPPADSRLYYYYDIDHGITANESNLITSWGNKIDGYNPITFYSGKRPLLSETEIVGGYGAVKLLEDNESYEPYYTGTAQMSTTDHYVCVVCKANWEELHNRLVMMSGLSYSYTGGYSNISALWLNTVTNKLLINNVEGDMPSGMNVTNYNVYIFKYKHIGYDTRSTLAYVNGVKVIDTGVVSGNTQPSPNGALCLPRYGISPYTPTSTGHVLALLRWKPEYEPDEDEISAITEYFKTKYGI